MHDLKAYRGSGDIAALILNRTELRGQLWVPSALPLGKDPMYLPNRRLGGPRTGVKEVRTVIVSFHVFETR